MPQSSLQWYRQHLASHLKALSMERPYDQQDIQIYLPDNAKGLQRPELPKDSQTLSRYAIVVEKPIGFPEHYYL